MRLNKEYENELSIIIVAFNVKDLVKKCLGCLKNSKDTLKKEIIYVENGSVDGTAEMVEREFPEVKVLITPINLGFIGANNLGYKAATGKYILMLNSDAFVGIDTLQTMVNFLNNHSDCGIVGCNAIDGDGRALSSARYFPTPKRIVLGKIEWTKEIPFMKQINDSRLYSNEIRECDWVTGCCLMVRKEIIDSLGFFLRPDLFMYNDDNDLCLRVKSKGWKVYCLPETITHLVGINNKKVMKEKKDPSGLTRLGIESDYVYFRHNYGLFSVLEYFSLLFFYETGRAMKNCLLLHGKEKVKESMSNLKMVCQMLIQTKFGRSSIDRRRESGVVTPLKKNP